MPVARLRRYVPGARMIRAGHDFEAELSTGKWLVIVEQQRGLTIETQAIVIPPVDVHSKDYLDTCCHEALHASWPQLGEERVRAIAGDLAEVLWKRGYRLPRAKKSIDND
jgi:hypothetical protein